MELKRAYVTCLATDSYLPGVLALHFNLKNINSAYPLVVLISSGVANKAREKLKSISCEVISIDFDVNGIIPSHVNEKRFKHWSYTLDKLSVYGIVGYEKIVLLDSDLLLLENIDHLFEKDHFTAPKAEAIIHNWNYLNSSTVVIEPNLELLEKLLLILPKFIENNYSFGDQDIVNEFFPEWNQHKELILPPKYNVYIYFLDDYVKKFGYNLSGDGSDKSIAIVHFAGAVKPWMFKNWKRIYYYITRLKWIPFIMTMKYLKYILIGELKYLMRQR